LGRAHRTATLQNPSRFGQPTFGRAVAVEVADPGSWQHDCYGFENVDICRYSDAAVIRADTVPNGAFQVGYIARTLASGSLPRRAWSHPLAALIARPLEQLHRLMALAAVSETADSPARRQIDQYRRASSAHTRIARRTRSRGRT